MIRVDLLDRQRRWSWSKALLSILVVCGGLYGIHQFSPALVRPLFNTGSDLISKAQQELAPKTTPSPAAQQETTPKPVAQQENTTPSPVVQQETTPEPTAQQETTPSPVQETTPKPVAQQENTTPSPVVQQETTPEPTAQQETTPEPVAQQENTTPSPVQETTPKPVAQQENTTPKPVVQQEITPEPVAQQETTPSPVQEVTPSPAVQQENTPEPQETTPSPGQDPPSPAAEQETTPKPVAQQEATPSSIVQRETTPRPTSTPTPPQDPSSQRNTACHQVMRINEKVSAGIRVSSLNCNSRGEYWLEGTSPSNKVLRMFRLSLQALPSRISFSTWWEERTLRFSIQGRFVDQDAPPLAPLSSSQAEQFFSKVIRWADASGLDSLSIQEPIHRSMSPARTHQRQKLRGLGSPQQIDAFLQQLQQAEEVATLGEILLMPVKSDENGWVQARLYAAVDIIVEGP